MAKSIGNGYPLAAVVTTPGNILTGKLSQIKYDFGTKILYVNMLISFNRDRERHG